MKLDLKDRYIISNQLKILEALYPDDAESYETDRKAIENGYSLSYGDLTQNFYEEMSIEECKEVLNILDMYRAITFSSSKESPLENDDLDSHWIKFRGFDGNNESEQLSYARYFIIDLDRFSELKYGVEHPDLNSHSPTLQKYRAMLSVWLQTGRNFDLNDADLRTILKA